jgi:superfamily II DNA or RNA helicase
MYTLFDYQQKIRDGIDDFFNHGGQRLLVQAPTGSGKSVIMCDWINKVRNEGKPIYFVTHSKGLLHQFSDHLTEIGMPHGLVAAGSPVLRYKVQVISAQSLMTRAHLIDEPYAVLFEEAHHSTSNTFKKILNLWKDVKLVGMTATPERPDGTPLGDIYENMILSPSVRWFIDNGYLSDYEYFVPSDFDTSGIHRVMGDFNAKELNERIKANSGRVGSLVENYKKYAEGLPGIAFGVSIADSDEIAEKFNASGYDMKSLHSKMSENPQDVLNNCRNGKQKLISSCDLIGEGVDVKGLEVMIDARPTQSLVVQMQHWGRVLRVKYAPGYDLSTKEGRLAAIEAGGKKRALILDFASNYSRHGLPDDEREWSLKPKAKNKKTQQKATLKRCPNCERPIAVTASVCPFCNYVFTRITSRKIEERLGELINIKSLKDLPKMAQQDAIRTIARRANNLKQAIAVGAECGINNKSAWFIWKQILKRSY